MEEHIVKILNIEQVTYDVGRFQFEKPEGYTFIPGQATDVSINSPALKNEKDRLPSQVLIHLIIWNLRLKYILIITELRMSWET